MSEKGWRTARLGDSDVAYTASGGTPDRSTPQNFGGSIPWVKSGELNDGFVDSTEETLTSTGLEHSSARVFPRGTLLVALYGATAGKTGILGIDASTNQAVCAIFPQNNSFDSQFLQFQLIHLRPKILNARTGGAQPNISQRVLASLDIWLPPLPEQRAIAHVLTTVQQAKETRQRDLALERERKAALMEYLFTFGVGDEKRAVEERTHGRSPIDWDVRLLDDCAFIQTGVAKGRKFNGAEVTTVPYLRVANVQNGYLDLSEIKEITIRKSELARYQLAEGDVVLTEGGDFDKLGRGFVWDGQVAPCVHQNHIFAVRPNRDMVQPEFLAYLVQSPYGRSYFLSVAHKTTNLACINKTKLGRFPVLVPTPDEQQRITSILKACDAKISAQEREVARLRELFDALLQELLSGKRNVIPLISEDAQA